MQRLLEFAAVQRVDRVVSVDGYPSRAQLRASARPSASAAPSSPRRAAGARSRPRDLTAYVPYRAELAGSRRNIGYCRATYFYELPEGLYPAGPLAGARRARFVAGQGLTCAPPPKGYVHRGFAPPDLGVPANTYRYYAPRLAADPDDGAIAELE